MFRIVPLEDWERAAPVKRPAHRPRQSHCKRGHAFDAANTRLVGGKRLCRACLREHGRLYRERAKARAIDQTPMEDARPTCPWCGDQEHQIKRGRNASGSQRYRCVGCARSYTPGHGHS